MKKFLLFSFLLLVSVLTATAQLTVSVTKTDVKCKGENTGIATANASGGVTPYSYSWSNGINTQNQSNLSAGLYTVVVTDNALLTVSTTVQISEPNNGIYISFGNSKNPTCALSDGFITVSAYGDNPPFIFSWNNNMVNDTIKNLSEGKFIVKASDAIGCFKKDSISLYKINHSFSFGGGILNNAHCGKSDGNALIHVSYGQKPYTYLWSNGSSDSSLVNISAGQYKLYVTDARGCFDSISVGINDLSGPIINSIISHDVECFGASSGRAIVDVSNGITPYSYSWSKGGTNFYPSYLDTGTYSVTVTDAVGCTTTASVTITQPASPVTVSVTQKTDATCGKNNGKVVALASGGTPSYNYQWSLNMQTDSIATGLASGNYSVVVTDANGCTVLATLTINNITCVWPGDANNDLTANNWDVLQVGVGYGKTGVVRLNADNTWIEQPCPDWTDSIAGVNSKYADCNGDGIIDMNDTTAILLNYGQVHNKANYMQNTAGAPSLTLDVSAYPNGINAGQQVSIPVHLGNAITPVNNMYGVAFTVQYDNTLINAGTVKVNYTNSVLGSNLLTLSKNDAPNEQLDATVARINQQNYSGYGVIGTLEFKAPNSISTTKKLHLSFSKIKAVDNTGKDVLLNAANDSLVVNAGAVGIASLTQDKGLRIINNESTLQIHFDIPTTGNLRLMDAFGRIVNSISIVDQKQLSIETNELGSGIYFLNINTSATNKTIKVFLEK